MNPEEFLNNIATAIEARDRTHTGMYVIGIDKGLDLEKGFTSARWDSLSYRVAKAWAKEKI